MSFAVNLSIARTCPIPKSGFLDWPRDWHPLPRGVLQVRPLDRRRLLAADPV